MNYPRPNTFIAGAPKCGTTSLAHWLSEHPDIFVPAKKESHYFNRGFSPFIKEKDYAKLYEAASNFEVRIDASTSYFTSEGSIKEILRYCGKVKFIILLRNPIEVAHGLYRECYYRGLEDISDFETAWHVQHLRRRGEKVPIGARFSSVQNLLYRDQIFFGKSLKRLLSLVERERIHIIFSEDMKKFPDEKYSEVLKFLCLNHDNRKNFIDLNKSKINKYASMSRYIRFLGNLRARLGMPGFGVLRKIQSLGHQDTENAGIPISIKREIFGELREDILLLQKLTERDLSHWNPDCPQRETGT